MSKRQANTDVAIDVTSLISAEEFLLSQNRREAPEDPFARQCFVEIVQSLIFMSEVYVAHPVLHTPSPQDFGDRPYLLRALVDSGLLRPYTSTQLSRRPLLRSRPPPSTICRPCTD
ncbi:hypothetical protein ACFWX5_11325 [[Kitasatospora] papulosa]|uniref:hypothetical protein n=1 Tax=[Kitasatospora] papulosa TaxID=1464011 RepID=UPI0036B3A856